MTDLEQREDDEVVQSALAALRTAQQKAYESGQPMLWAENGKLYKKDANGITLVKQLPPPIRVERS